MPWQRDVLDIVCEIDPRTGLYWYRTFILVLPRQGGKTTLIRGKMTHRGLTQPGANMLYTAQDRNKARLRLEETLYKPLKESPLGPKLGRPRWAAGSEAMRFKNGSTVRIESLSKTAGHGDTLDEAYIDEAFAHVDNRIEQNVTPTMITVDGAQKWITSAMGGLESSFLEQKVEMGRALVGMGADSRTAYIEYGAAAHLDPLDPFTVLGSHPAIGHTISLENILDDRDGMSQEEYERAYLSWMPKREAAQTVIPWASWQQNFTDENLDTWLGIPMWSVDVSPDRSWASISLAAQSYDPSARCFVEVIDHEQGTAWVAGRLEDLRNKFGGYKVVIDGTGSASSLKEELEERGFTVETLTARERVDACNKLYDDSVQNKIRFLNDPVLNGAMKSATKINAYAGESWVFSRGKSKADITPLYSVAIARYGFVKFYGDQYDVLDSIA
jgi:hypothetical protein